MGLLSESPSKIVSLFVYSSANQLPCWMGAVRGLAAIYLYKYLWMLKLKTGVLYQIDPVQLSLVPSTPKL